MRDTIKTLSLSALILAAAPAFALAGEYGDKASAHFAAIGAGNVRSIMADYSENAVFEWVGGPLDGTYAGRKAIEGVWVKFSKAQSPLEVTVKSLAEAGNPKGTTVTADLVLKGAKATIPLRYVLVYRGDKLTSETWQINPPKK